MFSRVRVHRGVRRLAVAATMSVAISAAAVTGLAAPVATAAPGPVGPTIERRAADSRSEMRRIESYWTADRMQKARPVEERYGKQVSKKSKQSAQGKTKSRQPFAQPQAPQPKLGKVFFTLGGADYVCSGTATTSQNADVVTSAGHCVNEGPGDFATNWAFVPAYDHGAAPYGKWTARSLLTSQAWASSGDFNYDIGFAVMNSNASGKSLTEVVGSVPIAFNLARGLTYTSYGYPAASPFDGQSMYSCTATAKRDTYGGSDDQGIACDMTGGSSGGGWLTGGRLNSVNSFGYNKVPNVMWGPYFGSVIHSVYNAAQVK